MDWMGGNAYEELHVSSAEGCQNICRDKAIKNFVWVRTNDLCVCKDVVTGERSSTCCVSGHATGGACEGELTWLSFPYVNFPRNVTK